MRKKINYSEMNSLGSVLDSVIQASNLRAGMKTSTVFKFWAKVAGKKFEKVSRAESITRNNVLVVACANSFVTSELTMFKPDLMKKINLYANPLGIEIEDINFSHKIWKKPIAAEDIIPEPPNPHAIDLSGFNADDIEIDEAELSKIKENVEKNTFASEEQRARMFETIVKDLKIQKYLKNKP